LVLAAIHRAEARRNPKKYLSQGDKEKPVAHSGMLSFGKNMHGEAHKKSYQAEEGKAMKNTSYEFQV